MTPARLFVACIFLALLLLLRVLAASAGPPIRASSTVCWNGPASWLTSRSWSCAVTMACCTTSASRLRGAWAPSRRVPACRCSASKAHRIRDHRGRHW